MEESTFCQKWARATRRGMIRFMSERPAGGFYMNPQHTIGEGVWRATHKQALRG
jgi:hypothetical protein